MGLDIDIYLYNKNAQLDYGYHTIHILREYACKMIGATDEDDPKAKQEFPNLIWHSDAEGYYVGFLPEEWDLESHLWVGSVEGLYNELQRISADMIQTNYDGDAKRILSEILELFSKVEYTPDDSRFTFIIFH